MRRLLAGLYAALIGVLVSQLAFGAGFFEQGQAPPGGYPSSPTFVHVGTNSMTAVDNVSSTRGYFSSILQKGGYDVYAKSAADNAAIVGLPNPALDNLTDGSYNKTLKVADVITGGPWVDARKYGAVGGGADDTAEIQAAIDALPSTGGTVLIPLDNCLLTGSGLSITKPVHLLGRSSGKYGEAGATVLSYLGSSAALTYSSTTNISASVSRMKLDGMTNTNAGVVGILISGASSVRIDDVSIRGFKGTGANPGAGVKIHALDAGGGYFNKLSNLYISSNGNGIVLSRQSGSNSPTGNIYENIQSVSNDNNGFLVGFSGGVPINNIFIGGQYSYNGQTGISVDGIGHTIINTHLEGNGIYDISSSNGSNPKILLMGIPSTITSTGLAIPGVSWFQESLSKIGALDASSSLKIGSGASITKHFSATDDLDFGATAANSCETKTLSMPGVTTNASPTCSLSVGNAFLYYDPKTIFMCWISADNVASVRRCNLDNAAATDLSSGTVRVDAWIH